MEKEIQDFFLRILDQRKKETTREAHEKHGFGDDYLGSLLRANHDPVEKKRISVQEIIDECKTFYSAGHATTSTLLSWTALLLAIDSEWQEKARQEVLEVFGPHNPNSEGLSKLKTMSMIINESLRLYPPVPINERKTTKTSKLGNLIIPPNTKINMPILALHHDPAIWGDDAHLFKPERFSKGIAEATKNIPAAFSPFGLGPRTCVGMSFATNEAKIALCMILQRYTITLSPNYVHSPVQIMSLRPQHGVKVVLHAL
ncbi:PREDICTED: cytochrome P450 CYP749A22-like [Erythranthe guttata]|nr:PREDICTED: cytochrome P450 CYP749A22-like [Erythranthe guttata]|eukprot:XP_012855180.1 PREDICTED: cytochrome P450 CYP749A22-like [Erythranthe guttata]